MMDKIRLQTFVDYMGLQGEPYWIPNCGYLHEDAAISTQKGKLLYYLDCN